MSLVAAVLASAALVRALAGCSTGGSDDRADGEGGRTTTTYVIDGRHYRTGDCVMFDQVATSGTHPSRVVPCSEPHVVELVGDTEIHTEGDRYPGSDQVRVLADKRCRELAARYLGEPLLVGGRFVHYGLGITPQGWAVGERTYRCGLAEMDKRSRNRRLAVLLEQSVKGQSQIDDLEVGTCQPSIDQLRDDPTLPAILPCDQPHGREVTGEAPISDDHWDPNADVDAEAARTAAACRAALDAYAGPDHPGVHSTELGITKEAMALGDRDITCLAVPDGDQPLVGSVRR